MPDFSWLPANQAATVDVQEQRDAALLEQTGCGTAGPTSGLTGYGRQVGAHVLEGYPIEPPPRKTVIWDEASVGVLQVFLEAGYELAASPTLRRRVVRRRLA